MRDRGPDDMGDDDQETEVGEYEQYIESPPRDRIIREQDGHAVGISEWVAEESRRGEPEPAGESPENSAMHIDPNS